MPEDADDERLVGILDRFDRAVRRPRRPRGGRRRFDRCPGGDATSPAPRTSPMRDDGIDADRVLRELPEHLAVLLVPDDLGQVLDDVAAAGDVEHLEATADREHRQVARERRLRAARARRGRARGSCPSSPGAPPRRTRRAPGRCRRRRPARRARRAPRRSRSRRAARAPRARRPARPRARMCTE